MIEEIEQKLRAKGWDDDDIAEAVRGLMRGEELKSAKRKFFDKFVYWFSLFFTIVASMVVGVAVVPFLLMMQGVWLFGFISLIAASFGSMLGFLLNSIESMKKNAVKAGLFIPFLALMNIYIITRLSNVLAVRAGLPSHNPWLISIMYVWMFCLPYFAYKMFQRAMSVSSRSNAR